MSRNELILLPPLKAQIGPSGGYVLTRKYVEGAEAFAAYWAGPVTSLVTVNQNRSTDMDHVEFCDGDTHTGIERRPQDSSGLVHRLQDAAIVLAFLSSAERALPEICNKANVPVVFTAEYSPKTERQIVAAETSSRLLRFRRGLWISRATRQRRAMLREAAGLQCNGVPAFQVYGGDVRDPLLYFDNRVRKADVITATGLAEKQAALQKGRPLRLVFGGRLIGMKGAGHMPGIAHELVRLGVDFSLDIYGAGPLEAKIRRDIDARGLADKVTMKGVVDFNSGWVPMLKSETDLFICPHPQGDPSSTYTEVMSCGVPVVGYDNEAFLGVVERSGSGWHVPIGNQRAVAERIGRLDRSRDEIATAARKGRDFAGEHCFEKTFRRRADHLHEIARMD